jgi:hypothetical protein
MTSERDPPKPTVKMPLVREDPVSIRPADQFITEDQRGLFNLISEFVEETKRKEQQARDIEAKRISDGAGVDARHNLRYNSILSAVQDISSQLRNEFKRETTKIWGRIQVLEDVAGEQDRVILTHNAKIEKLDERVESLEVTRAREEKRAEFLKITSDAGEVDPWDIGEITLNGTHKIISVAEQNANRAIWADKFDTYLADRDKSNKAEKWTTAVKWMIALLGTTFTAVVVTIITLIIKAHQ